MIVSRQNLLNFGFFLCLAMFSAWAVQIIFVFRVYVLPPEFFENIMHFEGFAPDQYRILPYLILRVLNDFLGFEPSVFLLNFFSLLVANIFLWHIFDSRLDRVRKNTLILFSFLYIVSMLAYFRPVTAFVVALVSAGTIILENENFNKYFGLIFIVLSLSFARADIALVFSLFAIFYYKIDKQTVFAIVSLPVLVQIVLKYAIFPDAVYYCQLLKLKPNFSSLFVLKSPLFWFFIAMTIAYWVKIKAFLRYHLSNKKMAFLPFVFYLLLIVLFARIDEFRLYLPLFPMIALMCKDFALQSGVRADTDSWI